MVGSFILAGANNANAVGNAYFNANTTVPLTINSETVNFTIAAESNVNTVTFGTSSITLNISSGQIFTLSTTNRNKLVNDGGFDYNCTSSESSIVITVTSTKTVVITPSASTCQTAGSSSGSSGGGGGGGGGGITQSTPTPTPSVTPTATATPISSVTPTPTINPTVSTSPTPVWTPVTPVVKVKLYKKIGDTKVYKQNPDGTLEWIKTLEEFNAAGYKWSEVKQVSAKDFAKLMTAPPVAVVVKIKLKSGVTWLNVRNSGSLKGKIIGKVLPGQVYTSTQLVGGWYEIQKDGKDWGWVFATYVVKI